jgi:hypothetical protein
MTRTEHRQYERALEEKNKLFGAVMKRIPQSQWPIGVTPQSNLVDVWRNREYVVQVYQEKNGIIRLSILRTSIDRDGNWLDGISWDKLQEIKSAVGFGECDAVEIYPKDKDVANVANIRHLWIVPDLPFAWRS